MKLHVVDVETLSQSTSRFHSVFALSHTIQYASMSAVRIAARIFRSHSGGKLSTLSRCVVVIIMCGNGTFWFYFVYLVSLFHTHLSCPRLPLRPPSLSISMCLYFSDSVLPHTLRLIRKVENYDRKVCNEPKNVI